MKIISNNSILFALGMISNKPLLAFGYSIENCQGTVEKIFLDALYHNPIIQGRRFENQNLAQNQGG
jgi:hypothetical protein